MPEPFSSRHGRIDASVEYHHDVMRTVLSLETETMAIKLALTSQEAEALGQSLLDHAVAYPGARWPE